MERVHLVIQEQHGKHVIQRDLYKLGIEWSIEEAEMAAQDRAVWEFLSRTELHEADW